MIDCCFLLGPRCIGHRRLPSQTVPVHRSPALCTPPGWRPGANSANGQWGLEGSWPLVPAGGLDAALPEAAVPRAAVPTGVLRAALCLDVRSYSFGQFLGVAVGGTNGELPNTQSGLRALEWSAIQCIKYRK
jgi:hypothetical protein